VDSQQPFLSRPLKKGKFFFFVITPFFFTVTHLDTGVESAGTLQRDCPEFFSPTPKTLTSSLGPKWASRTHIRTEVQGTPLFVPPGFFFFAFFGPFSQKSAIGSPPRLFQPHIFSLLIASCDRRNGLLEVIRPPHRLSKTPNTISFGLSFWGNGGLFCPPPLPFFLTVTELRLPGGSPPRIKGFV